MPAFSIEFTGEPEPSIAELIELLERQGYTQLTSVVTRLEFSRAVLPDSAPLVSGDEGIDVSEWNHPVDFAAVVKAGRRFVYIRATKGLGVDKHWVEHWRGARSAGLKVGFYAFFNWDIDGARQADHFLATLAQTAGADIGDLPLIVDVEPREIEVNGQKQLERVDRATSTRNLRLMLARLAEKTSRIPGIYTNQAMWAYMVTTTPVGAASWAKDYPLFVADWNEPLDMPAGFVTVLLRQYRVAKAGELEWHSGALDLDVYIGDYPGPLPMPEIYTLDTLSNQEVINLFARVFGKDYWSPLKRGLGSTLAAAMIASPEARRSRYAGPGIEGMASDPAGKVGLTGNEKGRLIAAL